jgi:hypothetical protein
MLAYRQTIVVETPNTLVLHDLPLQIGQSVEVLILVNENTSNIEAQSKLEKQENITQLLAETSGCLGKKTIEEIDQEITAMRQEWEREWE